MSAGTVLAQLRAQIPDRNRKVLIKGGVILTMDRQIGDLVKGDILVVGSKIADVGHDLSSAAADGDAIIVDASDRIIIPGMQDTHRHCWQNQLRRLIPDCDDNSAYLAVTHEWVGFHYRPHDIYVGNLISALGCIDAGITCVLDFFHNPRTTQHSDAAIKAFQDVGIRGVHASCGCLAGEWDHNWPDDLPRLKEEYFSSGDQLLRMSLGVIGADFAGPDIVLSEQQVLRARELGLPIISDGVVGKHGSGIVERLGQKGLLGPDVALIHCLDLSDTAWKMIADNGVNVSIPTTSDAQIGIWESIPSIQRALDVGIRPGLSVDVEVVLGSDMFTQMRTLLNIQRMMAFNKRYNGDANHPLPLTVRDMLELATIHGAVTNLTDRTSGSITPGKDADLVMINAMDWNTMPLNNAYGTVVSAADTRNVEAVFVAGKIKKWDGDLVEFRLDEVRKLVEESRDYVLKTSGFKHDILRQEHGLTTSKHAH
ncbi:MAG: amidohydrolase family protein [Parvularculaceae bacterium]|nr:amidohydrolase family protein [Parvularculaceae bacterium]